MKIVWIDIHWPWVISPARNSTMYTIPAKPSPEEPFSRNYANPSAEKEVAADVKL